jgi:hypothetical protein
MTRELKDKMNGEADNAQINSEKDAHWINSELLRLYLFEDIGEYMHKEMVYQKSKRAK